MKKLFGVSCTIAVMVLFASNSAYATLVQFDDGRLVMRTGAVVDPISGDTTRYSDFGTPSGTGSYTEEGLVTTWGGGSHSVFVGNYYTNRRNGVMHWHDVGRSGVVMRFGLVTGGAFNLRELTLTSNTIVGGGAATGGENSHLMTSAGDNIFLPSNNWGDVGGQPDAQLALNLMGIEWFELSSSNAFCLGVDNIEFDPVPEPATLILLGSGLLASFGIRRKRRQ